MPATISGRPLAHQPVIAGHPRLALGAVENQMLQSLAMAAEIHFDSAWKYRATQARRPRRCAPHFAGHWDAGAGNRPVPLDPALLAIDLDAHAPIRQTGRMRHGLLIHRNDNAGSRRMDSGADVAIGLADPLTFETPDRRALPRAWRWRRCAGAAAQSIRLAALRLNGLLVGFGFMANGFEPPWNGNNRHHTAASAAA
jgi:hypothetical protein